MSVYSGNVYAPQKKNDAWSKIFNFVPKSAKVLDVGCSSGHLGAALKKTKGSYVVGVDINSKDINMAKKVLDEALVYDLEKDKLDPLGKFDVIIMADVIEHLVDPVSVLKKLKQLLKENGRFIFSIPNMANATIRLELLGGRFEYKDFGLLDRTHLHFYDHIEVQRVLSSSGLSVMQMDCTIRIIPKDILKREVEQIGLVYTDKFEKYIHSSHGDIFQFIGYAGYDDVTKRFKIESSSSLDSITREIDGIRSAYDVQIRKQQNSINDIGSSNNMLQAEVNALNSELSAIKSSKSWKIAKSISRLAHPKNIKG